MTRVAIAGAGNAAFTAAALLSHQGCEVTLWSPTGTGTKELAKGRELSSEGSLNGSWAVKVAATPQELCASADLIMTAIPAYGHRALFRQIAPYLSRDHSVLITGGAMGYGVQYLNHLLRQEGRQALVGAIHGPICMGRKLSPTHCVQVPQKTAAWTSATRAADTPELIERWTEAFGPRFKPAENLLGVTMRAMGGVVHGALTLANITRVEFGEEWCGYGCVTESVSNLAEALDKDRVAVGHAYGLDLAGIVETYAKGDPAKTSAQHVLQPLTYERTFRNGPQNISTRYIEEEVPYQLVPMTALARAAGLATPSLDMVIDLYGVMRRKDYRVANNMTLELGVSDCLRADDLAAFWSDGRPLPKLELVSA